MVKNKPQLAASKRASAALAADTSRSLDDAAEAVPENEARMHRSISGALLDGKLRPGTALRERQLAEVFDLSRAGVRKVLGRLEREGKVELRQNRGAFVPQPSIEDIHTVYEARRAVEGGILTLLSSRLSAAQIEELDAHVRREEATHRIAAREESIQLAGEFHTHLTRMLDNDELAAFLQRLLARTQLFVALYESHTHTGCAPDEHRGIVDALKHGEGTVAVQQMLAHLDSIEKRVVQRASQDDGVDLAGIFDGY